MDLIRDEKEKDDGTSLLSDVESNTRPSDQDTNTDVDTDVDQQVLTHKRRQWAKLIRMPSRSAADYSYHEESISLGQGQTLWRTMCVALCLLAVLCMARVTLTSPASLETCLAKADVPFVAKDTAEWDDATSVFNLRLQYVPAAVVLPRSTRHIQDTVMCGAKNNVRVTAKSGGHSFGSFGLGGEDGHVVIALDRMHEVTMKENYTATVQPGARLGHIATELYRQAHRAIAHGVCPSVGIAGHVLHGGIGMSVRTHGLTLDWLRSAKVVLANDSVVQCSRMENSDLFWALRGAGSSFGIVAEFEFDTFEPPAEVTRFAINLPWTEAATAVSGLKDLQAFAGSARPELNMILAYNRNKWFVDGLYHGGQADMEKELKPLLQKLNVPSIRVNKGDWMSSVRHFAYKEALEQTYPHRSNDSIYATSAVTKALTDSQVDSLMSTIFNASAHYGEDEERPEIACMVDFYGGHNSAVYNVDPSTTSFAHRDKLLLFQFMTRTVPGVQAADEYSLVQRLAQSITESTSDQNWGSYANYIDTELGDEKAQWQYWGDNLRRLEKIKVAVDPNDVFWNPQGIRARTA